MLFIEFNTGALYVYFASKEELIAGIAERDRSKLASQLAVLATVPDLTEALGKSGATVALDQGYTNQSQDFTPVVLAIRQSGADVIGSYFTFENDLGIFARQLRQLGVQRMAAVHGQDAAHGRGHIRGAEHLAVAVRAHAHRAAGGHLVLARGLDRKSVV